MESIISTFEFPQFDLLPGIMKKEDWQKDWQNDENEVRSLYMGTVFSWVPSGKYYTPWANSNVDLCPHCKGKGITNPIESRIYSRIQAIRFKFKFLPVKVLIATYRLSKWFVGRDCLFCGGLGSMEAYHDSLWYEHVERKLDAIGLSLEHGEGDPCDLFITEYREMEDSEKTYPCGTDFTCERTCTCADYGFWKVEEECSG